MRSALQKASGEFIRRRLSLFSGYYYNINFIAHFIALSLTLSLTLSLIFMPYIAIHTAKTKYPI